MNKTVNVVLIEIYYLLTIGSTNIYKSNYVTNLLKLLHTRSFA